VPPIARYSARCVVSSDDPTSFECARQLGFDPVAKLVRGEPAKEIGAFAKQIEADLIVVGHRRQNAFDRWWSGPKGAYLMDYTDCSLLVARNVVSDEAIKAALPASGQTRG
jgi:Universal stress protein family